MLLGVSLPLAARQDSAPSQTDRAANQPGDQGTDQQPDQQTGQPADQAAPPGPSQNEPAATPDQNQNPSQDTTQGEAKDQPGTQQTKTSTEAHEDSEKEGAKGKTGDHIYNLTSSYAVSLSNEWVANTKSEIPPPAPLSPYAPPFHLSGNLVLSNAERGAILQFATSDNPLIGHDSYWLDTEMHAPSDSSMSLFDFFFYYFFPPSDACMHEVLTTYAPASRVSPTEGPANMQVYYSCPTSDTLSGFYAAQVSSGITFQSTDNGTRVLAPIGDFYVAPMDRIEEEGITFFIFEAQGMNAVSSDSAQRFHLPENASGGQPDFFWAIGAASPFPFVADPDRKDPAILHVAYARMGVDADARAEFTSILQAIRLRQ